MGKGDKAFFEGWGWGGGGAGAYYLTVFWSRPRATARKFKSKQVRQITQGLLLNELPP